MIDYVTTIPTTSVGLNKRKRKRVHSLGHIVVWILESIPDFVSDNGSSNKLLQASPDEIAEIIVRRRAPQSNPGISAVFGEPDFLPFPFLQIGLTRGAAVCRLVREFSEEGAKDFMALLSETEEPEEEKLTASELAEILCIDDEDDKRNNFIEKHQNGIADLRVEELMELQRVPVATGFLVGRNYLLTNYHVFSEQVLKNSEGNSIFRLKEEFVREYIAQFGYEQDVFGRKIKPVEYRFEKILCCDKRLDYALVKIEKHPVDIQAKKLGQAGDILSWIKMDENPMLIAPPLADIPDNLLEAKLENIRSELGESQVKVDLQALKKRSEFGEPVNIIQHPKGRRKEVILSNNRVDEIFQDFMLYQADTDFSSSGSPVLNQQWQLVGLHHAAIAKNSEIIGHKGIRICRIIENMRSQAHEMNEQTKEEAIKSGQWHPTKQASPPTSSDAEEILDFIEGFVDELDNPASQNPPAAAY